MSRGAVAPRGLSVTAQHRQGQAGFKASRHGKTCDAGNRPSDTTAERDRVGALILIQMPDRKDGGGATNLEDKQLSSHSRGP